MKPPPFEYHDPPTLDEALALLARSGDEAKLLAGGQSLLPLLAFRLARPAVIVDINRIPGLDGLREEGDHDLTIGALVRQRALERWARRRSPFFAEILRHIGHLPIRARGTIAGSLAHADPAAELPALLLCLEGSVLAQGPAGAREIPAHALFRAPLTTSLHVDEMIVEVRLRVPPPGAGWGFLEVARRHGDFALVGVVATVSLADDRIEPARVSVFGCGPTPLRATATEQALAGRAPTPILIAEAAAAGADALVPESDLHASAEYRRRAARALLARAVTDAVGRAGGARR